MKYKKNALGLPLFDHPIPDSSERAPLLLNPIPDGVDKNSKDISQLQSFIEDPKNIAKAAEGSMDKRNKIMKEPTLRDIILDLLYLNPIAYATESQALDEAEQSIINYFVNLAPKILRTSNKINRTDSDGGFLVAPSEAYNMGTADYQQNIRLTKKGN